MEVKEMLSKGLEIMGTGILVVFSVLGLFFFITKLFTRIWPEKDNNNNNNNKAA